MSLDALEQGGKRALAAALATLERDPDGAEAQVLLAAWRASGQTVGVIAVDPSSKASGGALLGDRVRIVHDQADAGSFVRSMAARARLGGLADQTLPAMVLMRALFDRVLIETVGQSETDVAGIVEIPHLVVVTKADLGAAAERARADMAGALSLATTGDDWTVRTLAVSSRSGAGVGGLMQALAAHRAHLGEEGRLVVARHRQAAGWIGEALLDRFGRRGLARLGELGLDATLPAGGQPFERLRVLTSALEKSR